MDPTVELDYELSSYHSGCGSRLQNLGSGYHRIEWEDDKTTSFSGGVGHSSNSEGVDLT